MLAFDCFIEGIDEETFLEGSDKPLKVTYTRVQGPTYGNSVGTGFPIAESKKRAK